MRLSVVVSLVLFSRALLAGEMPASHDLEVLPRFPGAEIVDFRQRSQERIYPQGAIRRISGRLRYEREVAAQGELTVVTYRLPSEESSDEAFDQARETLVRQGAEVLFLCRGRDCGSSSLWANDVFGSARLFGPDSQQAYALLRLAEPRQDSLLALYAITRGNRRAYLHVEQLDAGVALGELLPAPATLLGQLRRDGQLLLPRLTGEPEEAWTALLARSLNLDSTLRVSLAGAHAEAWRDALVAEGVRPARLELDAETVEGLRLNLLR